MRYIPKQDPMQDALKKSKKTTYFKLTLPNTGNKLKVAIWESKTPEQILLHVRTRFTCANRWGLTRTLLMHKGSHHFRARCRTSEDGVRASSQLQEKEEQGQ